MPTSGWPICEQGVFGGTCLNVGCIPTKMFVYAAEVAQSAGDSARYGVDAHVDGVRWGDIVSRVFGRIDPIAMGGENYRRSSPNVTVFGSPHPLRRGAAGRRLRVAHRRRRRVHRRSGGDRRRFARDRPGRDRRLGGAVSHQRHDHADRRRARASGDRRGRFRRLRVRARVLGAGQPGDVDDPRLDAAARPRTTRSASGSPTSPPRNGKCCSHHSATAVRRDGAGVEVECDDGFSVRGDVLLVATGRRPNGDQLDAHLAGVEVGRRTGRGRRVPADHSAKRLRPRRRVIAVPAQARRQPRGAGGQAQPAAGLGRHRIADAVPTTATCRPRCSPIRRSPPSG